MAMTIEGMGQVQPGTEVEVTGRPGEVETVYVDGIKGLVVTGNVTKVSFFEQVIDPATPGKIFGRYVLNLVMPNEQFVAIANLLKQVADENFAANAAKAEPEK